MIVMDIYKSIGELSIFAAMDACPQCVKVVNSDGIIIHINRTGLAIIEAEDSHNIIGANVYDFISEKFKEAWRTNHLQVCNGESRTWEYEIVGLKGTKRFLETYATPLKLPDGSILQLAFTKDITDKKHLQLTNERTEKRINATAEAMLAISRKVDIQSLIDEIATSARKIAGAHVAFASTAYEGDITNFVAGISTSDKYENHNLVIKNDIRKDALSSMRGWIAIPLKTQDGRNIGFIEIADKYEGDFNRTDETFVIQFAQYAALAIERQHSLDKLRDSEERFRVLANTIQNLTWMADAKGSVYWYNNRWTEYTGLTIDEMHGWGWQKVHHPDHVENVSNLMRVAWQKNEPFEIIHPLMGKDGTYKWFLSRGTPICDPQGNILEWIGTLTDIDEQKRGEELLEDLVIARTMELHSANMALQRSNEELARFAHTASHDLKEPVRKIRIYTDIIRDDIEKSASEETRLTIRKIEDASRRMADLIDGILKYSSLSQTEEPFKATDLNAIINEVVTDLEMVIASRSATVIKKDNLPTIQGMPILLHQLFYNVIGNSLKFSKENVPPYIEIALSILTRAESVDKGLSTDKDYCVICVKDNGIGFDQIDAKKIFETYSRLNNKERYEGTGLGLALCKRIAERHGGLIEAEGNVGHGALLKIILPCF